MFLWSASSIGKCVSFLGVLTVSVWLLTGTPTIGQSAKAPVTSTAPTKTTIQTAEKRLLALGYQCGAADGVMGAKAIAALKKFQADRRLPVTGQLDRKTLDALNAEGAKAPNVGVNKDVTTEGKYRDLQKRADGLECHLYATMALRNTGAGNTVSGGRSFECIDASKKSTEISLLATQNLPNEKVAIITKDFGTMYWRSDEVCVPYDAERYEETMKAAVQPGSAVSGSWHVTYKDGKPFEACNYHEGIYEMTDIQIKKLKSFLGL